MLHIKQLAVIGAIVFGGAAVVFYGQDFFFDKLYIGFLVFVAILFHRDINILSIIAITGVGNLSAELLYPSMLGSEYQIIFKILSYFILLLTLFRVKAESLKLVVIITLVICLSAELYWFITNYVAPKIYWHVLLIAINLLIRDFFWRRVFIVGKHFPDTAKSLDADIFLYDLVRFYIFLLILTIAEYFVRHIFGLQIDYIYFFSEYLFNGLAVVSALFIAREGCIIIKRDWLSA